MVRTIKAKFSKGVFEPLEPEMADLVKEGDEVFLTVSTVPAVPGDPLVETSGRWRGLVEAETLKRNIYADRLIATRPEARL